MRRAGVPSAGTEDVVSWAVGSTELREGEGSQREEGERESRPRAGTEDVVASTVYDRAVGN